MKINLIFYKPNYISIITGPRFLAKLKRQTTSLPTQPKLSPFAYREITSTRTARPGASFHKNAAAMHSSVTRTHTKSVRATLNHAQKPRYAEGCSMVPSHLTSATLEPPPALAL